MYKIFGQQKDEAGRRYIPSKLANKFLSFYRNCRLILTEEVFDKVYIDFAERAKYGRSDDEYEEEEEEEEELDIIVYLVDLYKTVTTIDKNILARWLKAKRYLQKVQQPYKEKYVKAQTD